LTAYSTHFSIILDKDTALKPCDHGIHTAQSATFHASRKGTHLARKLTKQSWKGIISIARGGLVPGAILARELNLRVVDTLCIASYDHDQQGKINILKTVEGDGDGYLLVDDLVDTGGTARIAKELLPKACFVTIYAKPQAMNLAEHFVREFSQDTWIHFPWDIEPTYSQPLVQ
jgi:xanthine phosphoribosyltransferase